MNTDIQIDMVNVDLQSRSQIKTLNSTKMFRVFAFYNCFTM